MTAISLGQVKKKRNQNQLHNGHLSENATVSFLFVPHAVPFMQNAFKLKRRVTNIWGIHKQRIKPYQKKAAHTGTSVKEKDTGTIRAESRRRQMNPRASQHGIRSVRSDNEAPQPLTSRVAGPSNPETFVFTPTPASTAALALRHGWQTQCQQVEVTETKSLGNCPNLEG